MNTYNQEKAENAILHISKSLADSPSFGSVILNKTLYYADHLQYRDCGEKITGFRYIKQPHGPTPHPAEFMPLKDSLIKDKVIKEETLPCYGYNQKRIINLVEPNLAIFTRDELKNLNIGISMFRKLSAVEASNLSHDWERGWQLVELMQEIPPYAFLIDHADATPQNATFAETFCKENADAIRKLCAAA